MSFRYFYMIGVLLISASCGRSDEKRPSLKQARAAIEVRDAWRDELKPVEIIASGAITGADRIGVRLTSDGKTDILPFVGTSDCFRPERPSLMTDTASVVSACWPLAYSDTLSLTAPFSDMIFGYESGRTVSSKLSLQMKFQSSMALLRFCFGSDNLTDVIESLTLNGEYVATRGRYTSYNGTWIEKSGEGMAVGIDADCLVNSGRSHDFYLIPCDAASDIVLSAVVNGKEYLLKTKIPPLSAGSMTQLNLVMDKNGHLQPKSSWVDNQHKCDLRKVAVVDTVKVGHYLRKDGLLVSKRDTMSVAVVYYTDGRHGKAVAIEDAPAYLVLVARTSQAEQSSRPLTDSVTKASLMPRPRLRMDCSYTSLKCHIPETQLSVITMGLSLHPGFSTKMKGKKVGQCCQKSRNDVAAMSRHWQRWHIYSIYSSHTPIHIFQT